MEADRSAGEVAAGSIQKESERLAGFGGKEEVLCPGRDRVRVCRASSWVGVCVIQDCLREKGMGRQTADQEGRPIGKDTLYQLSDPGKYFDGILHVQGCKLTGFGEMPAGKVIMPYFRAMNAQFLLAAAHSGAGKTTVTLGLLRALQKRGHRVQPFKCGPDYIDPIHHRTAAGRDSINLDRYMMSDAHIRSLYARYGTNADICITEGVMGLYDGSRKMAGSSAEIAMLLDLPVILILNAKAMAYTAAAILYGMKNFCPGVRIAGVLFNFVETASHYRLLQEACDDVGVTPLGHLPTQPALRIPSRHLGLDTTVAEEAIRAAAEHVEEYIDLEGLIKLTEVGAVDRAEEAGLDAEGAGLRSAVSEQKGLPGESPGPGKTILVARDEAFHFLYPENIRWLEQWGRVRYFSPLRDERLVVDDPELIYLPGGYPELHLEALAGNSSLLEQLRAYHARGGKILAECGGMMYLGKYIADEKGKPYAMTGILDIGTSMERKKLHLGYRTVTVGGSILKGHEFHYSSLVESGGGLVGGGGGLVRGGGNLVGGVAEQVYCNDRVLASYMHFYWGEEAGAVEDWLKMTRSR